MEKEIIELLKQGKSIDDVYAMVNEAKNKYEEAQKADAAKAEQEKKIKEARRGCAVAALDYLLALDMIDAAIVDDKLVEDMCEELAKYDRYMELLIKTFVKDNSKDKKKKRKSGNELMDWLLL